MAVIATGFFDGVHVGHRVVIDTLVQTARERGEQSVILTMWPHPRIVLHSDALSLRLLNTLDEKINLIRGLGVDRVEVLPFTEEFSRTSTVDFLQQYIKDRFGGTAILLGYDNRLGHDAGTPIQIAETAASMGLDVIRTDKVSSVGIAVSSTKIRQALLSGEVGKAATFLCYNYALDGEVVHGRKFGRTIGYPTANMNLYEKMKLIPSEGVYLTKVRLGGEEFYGMTNIGPVIETHILNFDSEIYGEYMRVEFIKRLRGEMRFESGEALRLQLQQDEMACRAMVGI